MSLVPELANHRGVLMETFTERFLSVWKERAASAVDCLRPGAGKMWTIGIEWKFLAQVFVNDEMRLRVNHRRLLIRVIDFSNSQI